MNKPKPSASTPSIASKALPQTNLIALSPRSHRQRVTGGFTKQIISKLACPRERREAFYWDASCQGFGLRALASGRRTWVYQYRDSHNRTRRIALGEVSAVSLDAARLAARQLAARVVQGANPSAERKAKKDAASVREIAGSYLLYAKDHQRPRSYEETERHLLKHAAPLHYERAETVTRADIAGLLDRIASTSGPFAANRTRAALSALWSWAMRAGRIESEVNPVTYTLRRQEKPRERILADHELRAIWTASEGSTDYSRIVRLCLLTGCRREEIGALRWEEILDDRIRISSDRMKANAAHDVPLLPAIRAALPPRDDGATGPVFGRRRTGFSGWSKAKAFFDAKLDAAGEKLAHWTLHDFRRAISTRLHNDGVEHLVVEAILAHKQQGIAKVYNLATFWELKCKALERWHAILDDVFTSGKR